MAWARVSGREVWFSDPLPDLAFARFERAAPPHSLETSAQNHSRRARGWVADRERDVEIWSANNGCVLRVKGGSDIFISSDGNSIVRLDDGHDVSALEREMLLGPALLLALASRVTFALHASAAAFQGRVFVFLGESGRGKSTLAAYLSRASAWTRVADDILPLTASMSEVKAWPRFPQLKVAPEAQPGLNLPESIPVGGFFILAEAESPALELLPRGRALQVIVSHTASARLFDERLLAGHLEFCAEVARQTPVYELAYPRRMEALAPVKGMLESRC